jgi:hypothetical protein
MNLDFSLDLPSQNYPVAPRQAQSDSGVGDPFDFTTDSSKQQWPANITNYLTSPETPWAGIQANAQSDAQFNVHQAACFPSPASESGSLHSAARISESGYGSLSRGTMLSGARSDSMVTGRATIQPLAKRPINQIARPPSTKKPSRPRSASNPSTTQRQYTCRLPDCGKTVFCRSAYEYVHNS